MKRKLILVAAALAALLLVWLALPKPARSLAPLSAESATETLASAGSWAW
jgi:hypothetical protein